MSLFELKEIEMKYGNGNNFVPALQEISLKVEEGDFVAVRGKSGCGKSTMLNILGGITKPSSGSYLFEDKNITKLKSNQLAKFRNQKVGFFVQHFALIQDITVCKNIALPLIYQHYDSKKIKDRVKELSEMLEIDEKLSSFPYELSGGQCQRVAIARALAAHPKVLLADEPTGALDEETGAKIMDIFQKLNAGGMTIVFVTHDLELASRCKSQIHMRDGKII